MESALWREGRGRERIRKEGEQQATAGVRA